MSSRDSHPWLAAGRVMCVGVLSLVMSVSAVWADSPSLDELLDIAPATPEAPAPTPAETGLTERAKDALTMDEARDVLLQALREMQIASERLGAQLDAGLDTQRIQEQILARLDQAITAAEQSSPDSSPGEGGGEGQSSDTQPPDQGSAQNQQPGDQPQPGQAQADAASGQNGDGDGSPAGEQASQADAPSPFHEQRAEWGNLPPRVREELIQGSEERFSPIYEEMTQAYYRRLAEEAR